MNGFKKIIFSFFIMMLVILNINPENSDGKKPSAVIIYESTKYKDEIVNKLEKELINKNITIKKDLLNNIDKYNPYDYNAVIILSGVAIFSPRPLTTMYIKKYNYNRNIIYFCTTGNRKAAYGILDQNKIDIITSASRNNNADEMVKIILEKFSIITN
jgi:hypothetical protein